MSAFRMPSLGADMEAGTLVRWRRQPGDRLERGDVIAEVETDKGVIEVEVFAAGVLERWVVEPGVKVPVGTVLAIMKDDQVGGVLERASVAETLVPPGDRGVPSSPAAALPITVVGAPSQPDAAEVARAPAAALPITVIAAPSRPDAAATRAAEASAARATPSARRRARELGIDLDAVATHEGVVTARDLAPTVPPRAVAVHAAAPTPTPIPSARLRSSPAARKRAADAGVDLARISGTGPGGAIVLDDVLRAESALRAARAPAPRAHPTPARKVDMRRPIAAAMARAKREIPHYYVATTIDLGRVSAWLAERNAARGVNERLVPSALLLKAVALAAQRMPIFTVGEGATEPPSEPIVHLGVAVSLRGGGLVAPAIHHADRLSVDALMSKLEDLVLRARTGGLRSSELSDGTLTVTSLGERGVEFVLPIIHPPQTAIVGFGRIAERPWVVDGALAVRPLVQATLAADHRVTDGHVGARFLALIDQLLQTPETL